MAPRNSDSLSSSITRNYLLDSVEPRSGNVDALSSSMSKSYLLDSVMLDDAAAPAEKRTFTSAARKHRQQATSMLEFGAADDMAAFGAAMEALTDDLEGAGLDDGSDKQGQPRAAADSPGGIFIDSSDRSDNDGPPRSIIGQTVSEVDFNVNGNVGGDGVLSGNKDGKSQRLVIGETVSEVDSKVNGNVGGNRKSQSCVSQQNPPPTLGLTPPTRRPPRGSAANRAPLRSSLKKSSTISLSSEEDGRPDSPGLNKMKRNVSFSSLEIRSYGVTLGDAPTACGPPVQLSWEFDPSATGELDLDQYEERRSTEMPRRTHEELQMPASHRHYLLMREAGFTRGQLREAMEEARRVAKQRERTAKVVKMGLAPVEEAFQTTRRRFSFGRKKSGVGAMA